MVNPLGRLLSRLPNFLRQAWLARQSIGVKLFIFAAILILVPLTIVGAISYHRSAVELENEARDYSSQVTEQVESHVEYYIRDFEINALKIMNHPDMLQFLRMTNQEQIEQSNIRQSVERVLKNAAYSRSDISNITIVLDKMQVIDCYGTKSPYPASELINEYWYHSVPVNAVPIMVSRVISWPDHKEPVLSLVKRVHSPNTLEPIGLLIIDINFRRIQDIAQGVNVWRNGQFFILDSQGHYVYHRNEALLGQPAALSYLSQLYEEPEGSFVGGNASSLTTFSYSYYLNWKFVTAIPYREISKRAAQVGQTTAATAVGALVLAYLLGFAFARTIVRPLKRLQRYMKNMEVGQFNEKIVVESEDEIGELTRGFNRMTERLSALMEEVYFSKLRETESMLRQKEMELKVLQAQVDPHFLTNSLETIRGMALAGGNETVASMAASLGTLLRYNLRNTAPTATLREEVHFCQVYLQIQEYRFEKQCECRYIIPDWALELQIVKFSLQPLVENCLLHGRWEDGRPLAITIAASCQQQDFVIEVIDNGVGIAADKLKELRVSLQNADPGPEVGSIGLRNLHRRIINLFGDSYGLSLESEPEVGTTVIIRLPVVRRQLGSDMQGDGK
ncbi:MAG: histidine kinase [Anaerosporomusa subterranea]|jgi:two-component system sensor histidine kinase YesM|nr:histidine kinase [Anaerosporomusa subterranea]